MLFRLRQVEHQHLGNPLLLHGDAVQHISLFHGASAVRNHDELRRAGQSTDILREPRDVHIVQRGLDLVQHAERSGAQLEDREIQRDRNERFFAARKQRQRLDRLARRGNPDIDPAVQDIRGIRKLQFRMAAAEYLAERLPEISVELGEFRSENFFHIDG